MNKLIDITAYPIRELLPILLQDKSTKKNIIWATDAYASLGPGFDDKNNITPELLLGNNGFVLQPRISKSLEEQQERTRKKAEVMTPVWLCNKMNNYADEQWFGHKDVFNHENDDNTWAVTEGTIDFGKLKWKKYVDSRRLEITCGEAPYLVSRYDTTTGESIFPSIRRIGMLDRKFRIVNENTDNEEEWIKWATRAVEACYGYEYQGDNLLIARINVLLTFCEYYKERWNKEPDMRVLTHLCLVITWNIWQMDGLKDTVPLGKPYEEHHQVTLFEWLGMDENNDNDDAIPCKIFNWRSNESMLFSNCKERGVYKMGKKLFDFCIGNPPYQEVTESDSTRMPPVYDKFMDEASKVADAIELITPARFLFNAGQTPKAWNQKMLEDPHFKVLAYEPDASRIFPNTEIKGGVAVTYRNEAFDYGAIHVFVPYTELKSILEKAGAKEIEDSLTDIADSSNVYDLKNIYKDHPDYTKYIGDNGKHAQLKTNVLNINPIFTDIQTEEDDYAVFGLVNGKRGTKYCHRRYLKSEHKSLYKYKVLIPKATGSGKFGDAFSEMVIATPDMAFTQTFISIGVFNEKIEAENLLKYLKTKFCRAMLYVLKVTQDNLPATWRYVPKQNFSNNSDIDWTMTIQDIDRQLYRKYGLNKEECDFIERNVKEMA